MKIHQLKIDFNVTERVRRFVYVYIIEAENCYLIDSGVFGCQKQIVDYLAKIGRKPEDVKGVFLTHAHPDHIGSAAWWQEHTDCKIYASEGEKLWIEDIDLQFKERPIGNALFIGDSVPVKGDIPIFIDEAETRNALNIIGEIPDVAVYYPAWDKTYDYKTMRIKLNEAEELIDALKNAVTEYDNGGDITELVDQVCDNLNKPMLKENPLFARTVECLREGQL